MTPEDIWLLIYSQIVGIQHHPKNDVQDRMSPEECARSADAYVKPAIERWGHGR